MTGHILFDLLCIAYLIYKVFKIYSCYNSCQIFLPFYIYISHFVYPFTCYVHLGYQHVLAIVTNAAMNNGIQCLLKPLFSNLLAIYLEAELLDHMLILNLIFAGNFVLFSTVVYHFTFP